MSFFARPSHANPLQGRAALEPPAGARAAAAGERGPDIARAAAAEGHGPDVARADDAPPARLSPAQREHLARLAQVRRVLRLGAWATLLSGALDFAGYFTGKYDQLASLCAARAALATLAFTLHARLQRRPLATPRFLEVSIGLVFAGAAVLVALACALSGGASSPDVAALALVLAAQVFVCPEPIGRGAAKLGVTMAVFVAALAVASGLHTGHAAALLDPAARSPLIDHLVLVLVAGALFAAGGAMVRSAAAPEPTGRLAGRYVLKDRLGSGGMGDVWSAYHPDLKRHVAVKILRAECMVPPLVARFEREIRAMTLLSHPNTVRILDCGTTGEGLLYYAMELLGGETLSSLVEREGPLPPLRAIHIVRQAARALAEAHARGIVHRDIKPANILITEIGGEPDFVKLLDFGIAKHGVLGDPITLTDAGMLIGTPAYMSPEQASSGHVDSRADLYALGAVLFFALTGRPLFSGSASVLVAAHLSGVPPLPSAYSPHFVHPLVDSVVRTCLSKSPKDRFATALELDAALATVPIAPEDYVSWSARPPSPSLMPMPSLTPADRDRATVRPGPLDSGERLIPRVPEAPLIEIVGEPRSRMPPGDAAVTSYPRPVQAAR